MRAAAALAMAGGLAAWAMTACSPPPAGPDVRSNGSGAQGAASAGAGAASAAAPSAGGAAAPSAGGGAANGHAGSAQIVSQPGQAAGAPAGPAAAGGSCQELTARFDAALAAAKGACQSDTDCACYPDLRMDGKLGVTDSAAAATLTALSNAYRKQQCPTMFMSSARPPVCDARCTGGACK